MAENPSESEGKKPFPFTGEPARSIQKDANSMSPSSSQALPGKKVLLAQLRDLPDADLPAFLNKTGLHLEDLYRGSRGGWVGLRRAAGLEPQPEQPQDDKSLASAITRLLHLDDPERIGFLQEILSADQPPRLRAVDPCRQRLLAMLHAAIDSSLPLSALEANLARLWANPARRRELLQISAILQSRPHRALPFTPADHIPLYVHATYTKDEILSAFGVEKPRSWVAGVRWMPNERADVFFVTTHKPEEEFSEKTRYSEGYSRLPVEAAGYVPVGIGWRPVRERIGLLIKF